MLALTRAPGPRGRRLIAAFALILSAVVNPPRASAVTIIVDNTDGTPAATFTGTWTSSNVTSGGLFFGSDFWTHRGSQGPATMRWQPTLPTAGNYEVYVRHTTGSSRTTAAQFLVTHAAGTFNAVVNQSVNGGQWILVGTFPFAAGTAGSVLLTADTGPLIFTVADAVRWISVPPPDLSISDAVQVEGHAGVTTLTFTVSLSATSPQAVTFDYQTSDGSATTANDDYAATSGTATIPANTASTTVTVDVTGDVTLEGDETVVVDVTNVTNASPLDTQGVGTIQNDDAAPAISVSDEGALETHAGTTGLVFTVSLSNPTDQPVTVEYSTADGSATLANADYHAASGTLTIPAKASSGTITVDLVGDTDVEPDETLFLNLTSATNAVIADSQGVGTVQNDDETTGVERLAGTATGFGITRLAPHPMTDRCRIEFAVARRAKVRLSIVDLQGRTVATLVDQVLDEGRHAATWRGHGTRGRVPAGAYFVRFEGGGRRDVQRLVLTR